MPTQSDFAFVNVTVTAGATAVSVYDLLVSAGYTPVGGCVALNVAFSSNTYWGNASTVTNTDGALVAANTPVSDSATGDRSNYIPIAHMYVYKQAAGNASGTIYARFTP